MAIAEGPNQRLSTRLESGEGQPKIANAVAGNSSNAIEEVLLLERAQLRGMF